jgi:hypothetical protein
MENLVFQNDINLNSINFSTLDYHNWNIVNWGEHIFSDINASGEIIANTLEQANGWLNILKTNTDRFGDSFASWSTASLS